MASSEALRRNAGPRLQSSFLFNVKEELPGGKPVPWPAFRCFACPALPFLFFSFLVFVGQQTSEGPFLRKEHFPQRGRAPSASRLDRSHSTKCAFQPVTSAMGCHGNGEHLSSCFFPPLWLHCLFALERLGRASCRQGVQEDLGLLFDFDVLYRATSPTGQLGRDFPQWQFGHVEAGDDNHLHRTMLDPGKWKHVPKPA